jgi:predicted nucleotide-binding protein
MARRPTSSLAPQAANLTPPQMRAAIPKLQRRIRELAEFDLTTITESDQSAIRKLENKIDATLVDIFGHGTIEYNRYGISTLWGGIIQMSLGPRRFSIEEQREDYRKGIAKAKAKLESALETLREQVEDLSESLAENLEGPETGEAAVTPITAPKADSRKIFVVHGDDEAARESVARLLERLDLEPIILNEQVSRNQTIIEKIESYGREVAFAVVLLTPDDVGGETPEALQPRARQNVILELGYFIGRLGRDRVCALKRGEVEVPSDYDGVVYTPMDQAGAWKFALARELDAVGIAVDFNRVARG